MSDPAPADALQAARVVLRERFGFEAFRPAQAEVVGAVLGGHDVLCVLPTGGGKSLCYQLPALLRPGLTLVVSPLIALMRDQVDSLTRRGIPAAEVNSSLAPEAQDEALDRAERGEVRLLYVAPERFRNERFRRRILGVGVSLVAVDEAHCISQWGHDFRPDYRRLAAQLEALGRPQVIALTATASVEVQDDIVAQLALRTPQRFLDGLVRANLRFRVVRPATPDAKEKALRQALPPDGAVIVYCASRKAVARVAAMLRGHGRPTLIYHAGLADEERARAQDGFMREKAPLLVATNAFGMGVDRPDVRGVIHFDVPRTVEAYVQESGRAGRDGAPADCVLLFHPADVFIQRFFIDSANPPREVVTEVFHVLLAEGAGRVELTAEAILGRLRLKASAQAVSTALAVLDRAALVRRGRRDDNLAHVTVQPASGDLFTVTPLPPGLGRLLAHLVDTLGVGRRTALDTGRLADRRGVTEATVRTGLQRLHDQRRIDYEPAFRGRATEVRAVGLPDDLLKAVDFEALEEKRRREEHKLDQMLSYARTQGCRREFLLACFGLTGPAPCGVCDACRGHGSAGRRSGVPGGSDDRVLALLLEAVDRFDGRYGFGKLAAHLVGSRAAGVAGGALARGATYGALAGQRPAVVESWLHHAHGAGLLTLVAREIPPDGRRIHVVALSPAGRERAAALAAAAAAAPAAPRTRGARRSVRRPEPPQEA